MTEQRILGECDSTSRRKFLSSAGMVTGALSLPLSINIFDSFHSIDTPERAVRNLDQNLYDEYQFKTFVSTTSNREVLKSAKLFTEGLSQPPYNSLFIHGGEWLGATHIAHRLSNRTLRENPRLRVKFTKSNKLSLNPNEYYKSLNLMIGDDFHLLVEKITVQIQLLTIMEEVALNYRQVNPKTEKRVREIFHLSDSLISYVDSGKFVTLEKITPDHLLERDTITYIFKLDRAKGGYIKYNNHNHSNIDIAKT